MQKQQSDVIVVIQGNFLHFQFLFVATFKSRSGTEAK